VVDEHAEERPADELAETPDLVDAGTMDIDASTEVTSDSEIEDEVSLDAEASEGSDQEQPDPEVIEAKEEEVADMETISEPEKDIIASEEDTVDEVDDAEEDQPVEEDKVEEAVVEEDILPEDADMEDGDESDEAVMEEAAEVIDSEAEPEADAEVEEAVETEDSEPVAEDDRHWFVVHCYSGYENKVRHNLEQRIETMGMKNKIFDVVVPTEEEIEVKDGKRRTVERRVFPGYILVQMLMDEDSWYVVRNTPGVTGFVGMGNEPTPLRQEEVSQIVKRMEAEAPRIKVTYKTGQKVRIIDGPFNDFIGTVADIDMERAKVRVMVSFFGRETPVELDFLQVEKA
jgi:transcriptional antiterminator NusG